MSGTKYSIPTMEEVKGTPFNGFTVASTFSGAGGSCLGYRMAGYKVLWANEFIPAAQEVYRINHPETFLNTDDIRTVTPEQLLREAGCAEGDLDILDGSPPCAAFSAAGKGSKYWGEVKSYSDTKQRVDDLFYEYARILAGVQPKVFIAENTSGLVRGEAKGVFKEVLEALRGCGYRVTAKLLNAMWLGVPQARERVIFIGVRDDLGTDPVFPKPQKRVVTLREALRGVKQDEGERAALLDKYSGNACGRELRKLPKDPPRPISSDKFFNLVRTSMYRPCPTVTQLGGQAAGVCHPREDRPFTIPELKRIMSVPDDFILTGTFAQQWERLGRMVPPLMMAQIASGVREGVLERL